jgi:hypothetical protein
MHFLLITIQLMILISSPTLASDYALTLHLVSRQSSFFCRPVFLQYPEVPDTWTQCGSGYIIADCTCCNGGLIGCLTQNQTCAIDATGGSICCDNTSSDCPSNTETGQSSNSLTSTTSEAASTFKVAPTSSESFNLGTGSSTTTSAKRTSNDATSTTISGPSSSVSRSSSMRVYVVGATRGSHSFILQSAMPFIVIYYFLFVGIFA